MKKYPYYIAAIYTAGILEKIRFGTREGKKFKTWSDCANAIRERYKKIPHSKEQQILILEYTDQYQSKIINICQGDDWTSITKPNKLIDY